MKEILLHKITLENWRAQNITLDFGGKHVQEIRAMNGAGKSTIFDAWLWLLTGADSENRINYDLFDTHQETTPDTPAAVVEAIITIDGREQKLRRSGRSQFTRPRGRSEYIKAPSDKYNFYVDDIEVQAKAYSEIVAGIFGNQDLDTIKMMLNPGYYECLEWKPLRAMFQKIIGDITEADMVGDYSLIQEQVAQHGIELAKQGFMNRVAEHKRNLNDLNVTLEAKKRTLPDLDQCDEAQRQIEQKQARIAELDKEITGLGEANAPYVAKRREEEAAITEKVRELDAAKAKYEMEFRLEKEEIQTKIEACDRYNRELDAKAARVVAEKAEQANNLERFDKQIAYLTAEKQRLMAERDAVLARVFPGAICPTCGQYLPDDAAAAAKQRFFDEREAEVQSIVARGRKTAEQLAAAEQMREELANKTFEVSAEPKKDASIFRDKLAYIQQQHVAFEVSNQFAEANKVIADMQNALTVVPELNADELIEEKDTLLTEIKTLSEITAYRRIHAIVSADIEAVKKSIAATSDALADEEAKVCKCVEYERERASIISTRVNRYLQVANVRMLQQGKNGEYNDCCVVTVDSVGRTTNHANKIRAGVDVCYAFQRYYELQAPIFVDNCDAIASRLIPQTGAQQIRLVFDDNYHSITLV
jgi:DNA repair exonuclease SbcCD ATPase subunit